MSKRHATLNRRINPMSRPCLPVENIELYGEGPGIGGIGKENPLCLVIKHSGSIFVHEELQAKAGRADPLEDGVITEGVLRLGPMKDAGCKIDAYDQGSDAYSISSALPFVSGSVKTTIAAATANTETVVSPIAKPYLSTRNPMRGGATAETPLPTL